MSAEVLTTVSRIAAFCMALKNALASSQLCTRLRSASASLLSGLDGGWRGSRGTISTIGCILYSKRVGLLLLVAALDLDGGGDVLLADLQALLVASAHQAGPDHIGPDARLQRVGPDALAFERFRQLLRR